ncbi:hypothetical protein CYMTET_21975 [Cymbomonas tetramitiformis]|uniref:Uncharacterized protein n=1 Tax=Cymbomonas tetramitiformis TaxID=36881 RepID=A0AAE0G147_9CHLO|nr:hypothetical protein CYMTET_21975 [Cymbomonas tetramitiformis]
MRGRWVEGNSAGRENFRAASTVVIATVSPSSKDTEHSLNTIRHACIMDGQDAAEETRFITGGEVEKIQCGEVDVTAIARQRQADKKAGRGGSGAHKGAGTFQRETVDPEAFGATSGGMGDAASRKEEEKAQLRARSVAERKALRGLPQERVQALLAARELVGRNQHQELRLRRGGTPDGDEETAWPANKENAEAIGDPARRPKVPEMRPSIRRITNTIMQDAGTTDASKLAQLRLALKAHGVGTEEVVELMERWNEQHRRASAPLPQDTVPAPAAAPNHNPPPPRNRLPPTSGVPLARPSPDFSSSPHPTSADPPLQRRITSGRRATSAPEVGIVSAVHFTGDAGRPDSAERRSENSSWTPLPEPLDRHEAARAARVASTQAAQDSAVQKLQAKERRGKLTAGAGGNFGGEVDHEGEIRRLEEEIKHAGKSQATLFGLKKQLAMHKGTLLRMQRLKEQKLREAQKQGTPQIRDPH